MEWQNHENGMKMKHVDIKLSVSSLASKGFVIDGAQRGNTNCIKIPKELNLRILVPLPMSSSLKGLF